MQKQETGQDSVLKSSEIALLNMWQACRPVPFRKAET